MLVVFEPQLLTAGQCELPFVLTRSQISHALNAMLLSTRGLSDIRLEANRVHERFRPTRAPSRVQCHARSPAHASQPTARRSEQTHTTERNTKNTSQLRIQLVFRQTRQCTRFQNLINLGSDALAHTLQL